MRKENLNYYNFYLFVFFIIVAPATVCGQYEYKNVDSYKSFLQKNTIQNTLQLDKKIQKQYSNIIDEKNNELIDRLKSKDFLFDTVAYPYLNSIFNHVLLSNSLDKNQFHFFIDRTFDVNAYSFEDGTVVCNLGLLGGMENESQLAMVFCHEIGHYLLMHSNISIISKLNRYNSHEFLTQIKQIKKQEYNTKKQLENLLLTDVFDRSRHSRGQEKAADSLGMILFSNTKYGAKTVPAIFDYLNSAEGLPNAITIQSFLDKEKITIDDFSVAAPPKRIHFGTTEKKGIIDSLKTHPDCDKRKLQMQSFFGLNPKPGVDFITGSKQDLEKIKKYALFEEARYSKDKGNLGLYLYQLIQIDAMFPADKYTKSWIYNTLTSLYTHHKAHTFHEVVNAVYIPKNDKDQYATLLKLLDNLSLEKLDEIINAYYANNNSFIRITKN
ncbi:M48 family metallopeptidase [Mucilaginibacter sp.]|uniref:M48 family metallopeptidase n=1 Tax=Mucilaginibacter sp. TaxID=1882438 RepID=UPI0025F7ED63|nr:M48 family metallopeptidase [Mucilaginibacter sp.]